MSDDQPEVATADEHTLLHRLRLLSGDEVLLIGVIPAAALDVWPDRETNQVVITAERRRHYLQEHSEVEMLEPLILHTLLDPDKAIANLYRSINTRNDLMVSVWISYESDKQNSVHSARTQHRRRRRTSRDRGHGLWRK